MAMRAPFLMSLYETCSASMRSAPERTSKTSGKPPLSSSLDRQSMLLRGDGLGGIGIAVATSELEVAAAAAPARVSEVPRYDTHTQRRRTEPGASSTEPSRASRPSP